MNIDNASSFNLCLSNMLLSVLITSALAACGGGSNDLGGQDANVTQTSTPSGVPSSVNDGQIPVAVGVVVAVGDVNAPIKVSDSADIGKFSSDEMKSALADGAKVWRQQRIDINGVNKGACANCHSADGIELALWKFTNKDIVRRAHIDGVSKADQVVLVKYFSALRQSYQVKQLKEIATDHPFQPKGKWFTGNNNERDFKFAMESLSNEIPTLMGAPIASLNSARTAIGELRKSNPLSVKVGIEMPSISRDCVRGKSECSLNDWMSDLPKIPKPQYEAQWFSLNDKYISNPTDAGLRQLLLAANTMTTSWINPGETAAENPAGNLGNLKFNSMQILQHYLRLQQIGKFSTAENVNPISAVNGPGIERANFPFVFGDLVFDKTAKELKLTKISELPVFVRQSLGETNERKLTDDVLQSQKVEMHTPWWWAGFMFDPGLSSGTGKEYFLGALGDPNSEGLAFHQFYAAARNAVDAEYRAVKGIDISVTRLPAERVDIGGSADSALLFSTPENRATYRKLKVNWARMLLLLIQDELEKHGANALVRDDNFVCADSSRTDGLHYAISSAISMDGISAPFLSKIYNNVRALAQCVDSQQSLPEDYFVGSGDGLFTEWYSYVQPSGALGSKLGAKVESMINLVRQEYDRGYYRSYLKSIGARDNAGSITTGYLLPPFSGDYSFGEASQSQGRIWIDGKLAYDSEANNMKSNGFNMNSKNYINLSRGKKVSVRIERFNVVNNGFSLGWAFKNPLAQMHEIPTSQLFSRDL
jgi:hypothetical protein